MLGIWLRLKVLLSTEEWPCWLLHLAIHQHRAPLSLLVYLGLLWLKLLLCSLQQRLACFIVIVIFKHSMFYYKLHCLNILAFNCSLLLYVCMYKMRNGCTCATAQEHSVGHRTTWLSWFSPSIFPWVPGVKIWSPGVCSRCLYPTSPALLLLGIQSYNLWSCSTHLLVLVTTYSVF